MNTKHKRTTPQRDKLFMPFLRKIQPYILHLQHVNDLLDMLAHCNRREYRTFTDWDIIILRTFYLHNILHEMSKIHSRVHLPPETKYHPWSIDCYNLPHE